MEQAVRSIRSVAVDDEDCGYRLEILDRPSVRGFIVRSEDGDFEALAKEVSRLREQVSEVPKLRAELDALKKQAVDAAANSRPSLLETVLGPLDDIDEALPAGVRFTAADFAAIAGDDD